MIAVTSTWVNWGRAVLLVSTASPPNVLNGLFHQMLYNICVVCWLCVFLSVLSLTHLKGILIHILKKSNIDTYVPKNYRPIVISTTFGSAHTCINWFLIDTANTYITNHGLRFNPSESMCITFGNSSFRSKKWNIHDEQLAEKDSRMTYQFIGRANMNQLMRHRNQIECYVRFR